jgi:hypothetical protein
MRWVDLWWLAGYPVYQSIGTIRHEGSHALVAKIEGANITKVVLWPNTDLGRFTWGYTQWDGQTSWLTTAAPYFCDLIWFVGFFFLVTRVPIRNHMLWLNLVIVGLISPLVNSFVQWMAGIFGSSQTDVAKWLADGPDGLIHLYFLLTIAAYVLGLVAVFWRVPRALVPDPSPA